MGRKNGKPSSGSSGHAGGTRPGQTRKKPKDLSAREREECGHEFRKIVYYEAIKRELNRRHIRVSI